MIWTLGLLREQNVSLELTNNWKAEPKDEKSETQVLMIVFEPLVQ